MVDPVSLTVAVGAAEPITTGASPVSAEPTVQTYAITTGGTAGQEVIDLPMPDLPLDSYANGEILNRRVNFFLETMTDPDDVVKITKGGSGSITVLDQRNPGTRLTVTGVILDYVGAMASFVWAADTWYLDRTVVDGNDSTVFAASSYVVQIPHNSSGVPDQGAITFEAATSTNPTTNGSDIILQSGEASAGTADGGNIRLVLGGSAGGSSGNLKINNEIGASGTTTTATDTLTFTNGICTDITPL